MNYTAPPAFTLTTSLKKTIYQMHDDENVTPGPIYNISGTLIKQNSTTVGKSSRKAINHGLEQTPAPDYYNPKQQNINGPRPIFSKAKDVEHENAVPPCTWYKPEEKLIKQKSQCYSMGQKYPSIMDDTNKNPGPGHYQTPRTIETLTKSKSLAETKFTTTKRFYQSHEKSPGVGSYTIQSSDFLKGKRTTIPKDEHYKYQRGVVPGPSDYHIKSGFEHTVEDQPGKTLSSRLKNHHEVPDYTGFAFIKYFQNPETTLVNRLSTKKYSFSKSQRRLYKDNHLPGPTDYINDNVKPKNSFHSIIPKSTQKEYNDTIDNPGPGAYQLSTKKGPMYSIGKSKSMSNIADTPGVGRYHMGMQDEIKGIDKKGNVFPKGKRTSFVSTNIAGVGDYDIAKQTKQAKLGFGKADRFAKIEPGQPGPGDYQIHSIIGYNYKKKSK